MAIKVKPGDTGPGSILKFRVLDITLDSSYPAGGYSVPAATFGFTKLYAADVGQPKGYAAEYDWTNAKIILYRVATNSNPMSEPTGVDLSAISVRVCGFGE